MKNNWEENNDLFHTYFQKELKLQQVNMSMIRELDELVLGNMVFGKGIYGFHIKVENVPGVVASISQVAFNRGVI